jgi:hypothetical protein
LGGTDGNVNFTSLASGNTLIYDAVAGVWENAFLTDGTGISITEGAGTITISNSAPDQTVALTGAGTTSISGTYPNFTITSNDAFTGTVTSVSGTSPVASSGGATPAISLASGYGDTQNPYASKTANYVLAAPDGSAGAPTFRAIVAADIPTLNQNTTGTASNVTGTVAIANGGTGQTTANAALNALLPSQTSNSGKFLTTNGTDTSWGTISATGTVTSVAATVPSFLSISGSPITTSGTLAISYSGTALPIANGGTGSTTLADASIVTFTGAETLTNKTLTSPTLTTPNINSAQFATVSGTAPIYPCRAWVNFNGTGTVAIRASGNVSSVTDLGTGYYRVNFATALPDVNYAAVAAYRNTNILAGGQLDTYTTTSVNLENSNSSNSRIDGQEINVVIFR